MGAKNQKIVVSKPTEEAFVRPHPPKLRHFLRLRNNNRKRQRKETQNEEQIRVFGSFRMMSVMFIIYYYYFSTLCFWILPKFNNFNVYIFFTVFSSSVSFALCICCPNNNTLLNCFEKREKCCRVHFHMNLCFYALKSFPYNWLTRDIPDLTDIKYLFFVCSFLRANFSTSNLSMQWINMLHGCIHSNQNVMWWVE